MMGPLPQPVHIVKNNHQIAVAPVSQLACQTHSTKRFPDDDELQLGLAEELLIEAISL
ncbi:MAG TPA: hypothetical protein P5307_27770 [Pirellulaceae bacterium]|nr:hypothetical protein [Pirellulaceae bacterium]